MSLIPSDQATLFVGPTAEKVGGLTRRIFTLSRAAEDISSASAEGWSEGSSAEHPAKAELRADGVFLSGSAISAVRAAFLAGHAEEFTLALAGDGSWSGRFLIRSLTLSGKAEEELTFSIRLVSTGPVDFQPEN
ncbi:MAG: phage tail tube protein [Planctomycetota bacterium]